MMWMQRGEPMKKPETNTSVLLMIQTTLPAMTKSEAVVCDFILQHPEQIVHYSVAELAEKSGMTENNVSVRLYRVREKLRAYLNDRGYRT